MNDFKASAIKLLFPVIVRSDIPGRLRLAIGNYALIPAAITECAVHHIGKAFVMLSGVLCVQANAKIGSLLIKYDPAKITRDEVLSWIDTLVDTGIKCAPEIEKSGIKDLRMLEALFLEKFQKLLPPPLKKG